MPSSNVRNILDVYSTSTLTEKTEGYHYYETQFSNLYSFAVVSNIAVPSVVAAFAALSPNNAESTNYRALASCIAIVKGYIPETAPVIAYPRDKNKALDILRYTSNYRKVIEDYLKGPKTYAFYRNTLDPDNWEFITIDGHMYNIWRNEVTPLQDADMSARLYNRVSKDYKHVARDLKISPCRLQSILWITWKRIHRIVSSAQLQLESGYSPERAKQMIDQAPDCRTSCRSEDGKSTNLGISCIIQDQLSLELNGTQERTE